MFTSWGWVEVTCYYDFPEWWLFRMTTWGTRFKILEVNLTNSTSQIYFVIIKKHGCVFYSTGERQDESWVLTPRLYSWNKVWKTKVKLRFMLQNSCCEIEKKNRYEMKRISKIHTWFHPESKQKLQPTYSGIKAWKFMFIIKLLRQFNRS